MMWPLEIAVMKILDSLALGHIWLKTYLPEKRRWRFSLNGDQHRPRVYYGLDFVPSADSHVFGGMVKLQDLNKIYANHCETPNILYLISSALPHFPVRMAEMAKKAGVKLVVNQNGVAYPGWFGRGWEQCNQPMTKLHRLADYIFYQSDFCKMSADRFVGDICPTWEILYNPVDTSIFTPATGAKNREKVTMLLAGSHGSFYRPQTAIQALRLVSETIPAAELIIAGRFCWHRENRKAEEQVMECAKKEGVAGKVRYVGFYTQNQAIDVLREADLLLHTKYNDPCPRLVIEAMACGLPILYSATGGVAELVGDEAGYGVPGPLDWEQDHPPSPEKLAIGALQLIENLDKYSAAARQRAVSNFDVQPWLTRHKHIFTELLRH